MAQSPTAIEQSVEAQAAGGPTSGARSGVLLGAATATSIVANYVFLLAAGRLLGSDGYGALGALLGLLAVVLLPAGAVQMAVSREVSRRIARGDAEGADAFGRGMLRLALWATLPLLAVALALSFPLDALLNINSVGVVALAQCTLATALVFPVAMGVLQGTQRFHALATIYVFPWLLRLALLAVVASAGFRLGGAIFCTLVATLASAVVAVALVRPSRGQAAAALARPELRAFLRYLGPVAAGLVGITLLTHIDILVVKARFPGDDAGAYAAASAFARVAFFVPATILSVLFPRTAARQARGEDTADILGRSLIATAAFCGALALFYAAAGEGLVVTTFGSDFAEGGGVLGPFALAIGLYSIANVLVGYHLSRGERRYAFIVGIGVVVQLVALATTPTSLHDVVWTNVAVGVLLLVAHEVLVGSSLPALRAGARHFAGAVDLRLRRAAAEAGLVLGVATVFVCALFWPLVVHFGTTVVGSGSDSAGAIWRFWQWQHESGYHLFGTTHHTLTGAPFGWDEGNGLNIQWLLPYYAGYLVTLVAGPVAAYNVVLLSGYVLSAAAMYVLARYLGCARLVAAWAALAYVCFPWHLARTPHASLVHLEFLPILLVALVAAAQRPTAMRLSLVGLATLGAWLTSGYIGTMAFVAAVAFALAAALTVTLRRGAKLVAGSVSTALAATLFVALLSIASGVGRGAGLHRATADLAVYGLRPLELFVPSESHILFGDSLRGFLDAHQHRSNPTETSNYLGFLTIALLGTWLVVAWRGRRMLPDRLRSATAGLLGVLVASLLLAAPSPIHVFGRSIPMPSRLLWEVIPAVRVPSRWIALAMTALIPLAALGLQALWQRLERPGQRSAAAVALVAGAMVVSFLELTISPASPRFRTVPVPAEYQALDRTRPGIVAEYPLVTSDDDIIWQTKYERRLLNRADFGSPADDARRMVLDPATPGAAADLSLLGVTGIVTHADALSYTEGAPDVPNASWGAGYSLVTRTGDGSSVWSVDARPAPALVTLHSGFADPEPPRDNVVWFPFDSGSGVGYVELRALDPTLVRLVFDAETPAGARRVLRVADAQAERSFTLAGRGKVSVLVEVPAGLSRVLLKTDPPPTSKEDAIVVSAARAERATGSPELHAEAISPDPGF